MRQILFSLVSLLAIVAFILWWSARNVDSIPKTDSESEVSSGITEILSEAEKAKETLEGKTASASLDLSKQGLTKVPEYVFSETNLKNLDLSDNELTGALQAEIRNLQGLRSLDLSNNNFTGVPAEIGQLKSLEILDLSNNSLTGLPYELGNLSNLKVLRITGNNYSEADLGVIKKTLPASTIIETR